MGADDLRRRRVDFEDALESLVNPFDGKAAFQLTPADLASLLDNQVAESKFVEYKGELPGGKDEDKREFLSDVSAFANAAGGWIFYGIKEDQGLPASVPGLPGANLDAEMLRLEQILSRGVDPRIPGISMAPLPVTNGERCLAVRVPRSWTGPHMVTFGGSSRFFSRNNGGKYQLDVHELRQAFGATEEAVERLQAFRAERLGKILAGETPVPLCGQGRLVLHLLPLAEQSLRRVLDLKALESDRTTLVPMGESYRERFRFNFDGVLASHSGAESRSYLQVFRDGRIEAVSWTPFYERDGEKTLLGQDMERQLLTACELYSRLQSGLGIEPPSILAVSLLNIRGYKLFKDDWWERRGSIQAFDREALVVPEIWVEDASKPPRDLLRPAIDAIWNAGGLSGSPFTGEGGP